MRTVTKEQFVSLIDKKVNDKTKKIKVVVTGLYSYHWEFHYPVCAVLISRDQYTVSFSNTMNNELTEPMTVNAMRNIIKSEEFNDYDIIFSADVKKGGSTNYSYRELFSIKPGQYDIDIKEMDEEVIVYVKTLYI